MLSPIVDAGQLAAGLAACLPFLVAAAIVRKPRRRETRMIETKAPERLRPRTLVEVLAGDPNHAGCVGVVVHDRLPVNGVERVVIELQDGSWIAAERGYVEPVRT